MAKIEELYEEARKNPELASAFMEAVQENRMGGFLKEHDCSASAEEVQEFLMERLSGTEALSDEELDHVAGGGKFENPFEKSLRIEVKRRNEQRCDEIRRQNAQHHDPSDWL